jgi:hypothetical protein
MFRRGNLAGRGPALPVAYGPDTPGQNESFFEVIEGA